MQIKRVTGEDDRIGDFISEAFSDYSILKNVDLNYEGLKPTGSPAETIPWKRAIWLQTWIL